VLYNDSGIVESMQKPHAIMIEEGKCITPAAKLGIRFLGGVAVIIVLIAIGLIGALSVYLWYSRGSVGFNKYIDGDKVSVTVTNNTPRTIRDVVIEDVIPTGAEIHVHTLNALRKQNTLIWEVGALPPSDSATLEYRVRGGHAVNQAALKWHKGAKTLV
jgi:hypothetical protein